jgi:cation/acetate symporter
LNLTAILMFFVFVALTLAITWWAALRTHTRADFYAAGKNIGGLQNGLAIAGDFMSAATFLGISALVYSAGMDGMLFVLGGTLGWAVILLLVAETAATSASTPFGRGASAWRRGSVRTMSAVARSRWPFLTCWPRWSGPGR